MIHIIKFKQNVYLAPERGRDNKTGKIRLVFVDAEINGEVTVLCHRRGDDHLANDSYKADLDASGIVYELIDSITKDACFGILKILKSDANEKRTKGQYAGLSDIQENMYVSDNVRLILSPGKTEIWYCKRFHGNLVDSNTVDPHNLQATHIQLGTVACRNPEDIFSAMQGRMWSPNGEANGIIGERNLHTSMSIGDCLVIGNEVHLCQPSSWEILK